MKKPNHLELPALEIIQGKNRTFYSFAVDGKLLHEFATVSRIRRDGDDLVAGYQRPEVFSHIAEIRNYIESKDPLLPNAIVLAFDQRVKFVPNKGSDTGYSRWGTLVIPLPTPGDTAAKPGLIVDGQQRAAAIRDARVERFPICATAFIANDDREQREQFILVNSTKPLPKGLIYELLPTTEMKLPTLLQRRRFPAQILARLNSDHESPLKGRIRTPTTPTGVVQDNSILKMLENSLSDGVLYRYRDVATNAPDIEAMLTILKSFWAAASRVFPKAWGLPPARSRLMHGAGIVAMGYLMDAIGERLRNSGALRFADVLTFVGRRMPVRIITVENEVSTNFIRSLQLSENPGIRVRYAPEVHHEKGILTPWFYIDGSMNITYHGVHIRGEKITYHIPSSDEGQAKIARAYLEFGRYWSILAS